MTSDFALCVIDPGLMSAAGHHASLFETIVAWPNVEDIAIYAHNCLDDDFSTKAGSRGLRLERWFDTNFYENYNDGDVCGHHQCLPWIRKLAIEYRANIDGVSKVAHCYVPVPWASYIDKNQVAEDHLKRLTLLISEYRTVATAAGYELAVYSVCQHIHWIRILEQCEQIGITDLHISHKDSRSEAQQTEQGTNLTWPLIAVNYETPERSEGLVRKPVSEKPMLAPLLVPICHITWMTVVSGFLKLLKLLGVMKYWLNWGGEWHFNKIVYEEQVLNKQVDDTHRSESDFKTRRYNQVLSDSKFLLCPVGDGPNMLRFWESLAV